MEMVNVDIGDVLMIQVEGVEGKMNVGVIINQEFFVVIEGENGIGLKIVCFYCESRVGVKKGQVSGYNLVFLSGSNGCGLGQCFLVKLIKMLGDVGGYCRKMDVKIVIFFRG